MPSEYFINRNDKIRGTFSKARLRERYAEGYRLAESSTRPRRFPPRMNTDKNEKPGVNIQQGKVPHVREIAASEKVESFKRIDNIKILISAE